MTTFLNETGTIGVIYNAFTYNVTGSELLTLIAIIGFIMICFMIFRVPIELSAVLVMPMLIIMTAYTQSFYTIFGIGLIYLGFISAKYFLT